MDCRLAPTLSWCSATLQRILLARVELIERYFELKHNGTTLGREVVAGLTTFVTMSYIVVVNPAILQSRLRLTGQR
jgi:hypothetical protein